jgi:hypothetical protein
MQQKGRGLHPRTLGADKGYDTRDCVATFRTKQVTPHVAQNTTKGRRSAIDGRTTRHVGYDISQKVRKRVGRSAVGSEESATSNQLTGCRSNN